MSNQIYSPKELASKKKENFKQGETFARCFRDTRKSYFGKLKIKHLDKMIENNEFEDIFAIEGEFSKTYQFISSRETNKVLRIWTIAIGLMTFAMFVMTA